MSVNKPIMPCNRGTALSVTLSLSLSLSLFIKVKVKVQFTLGKTMNAPKGRIEVELYSFFNLGAWMGWVVDATPRPLYPCKETRYILHRMIGGPTGPV